ncbi:PH domain-containing protein [Actinoplanes derwentensis]|uniref:Putative membrane protein n=1 Tax=Actinoplanes derwentensis TaxID=113562 RepID=A0A1H1ZM99_9ACTN|nr:PH domain-containing protein [Actinoplanes derwentensis]GID82520.1 hypothetical protein Ade03nite_14440 [Actinoplanes derwentensis]SDT34925.1 putative membrane protein [Actinoplanes derwentensis]
MTEESWRRLSVRVVYLGLIRLAISLVTGYFGIAWRDDPVWPLLLGAAGGLLGAIVDLKRWQTTRFRITPERVEMRTGWISRKHRTVARDRIRSVDSSAKFIPRLLGLRTVRIGSGEAESSFELDALDRFNAERVQQELRPGGPLPETSEMSPVDEMVITRLRRAWIPLNVFSVGAVFAVAAPLFGLNWMLRSIDVDLLGFGRELFGWNSHSLPVNILLVLLVAYPLGFLAKGAAFVVENWRFELVRTRGALITRRGLFTTTTVQRSDDRTRGIAFAEPLMTRWLRLTRTKLLLTGAAAGEGGGGDILPGIRLGEARDLAAQILPDGARPLEAPLRTHPRGALVRRVGWAIHTPALLAGALLLFPLPGWVWPLPLLLIPVTVPLAVVAYRSLGHTVQDDYLVVREGALTRDTVALQNRAVLGWSLEQSIFQRWAGRMTVGIATAAGSRHYQAHDVSVDQALTLITEATPALAAAIRDDSGDPARVVQPRGPESPPGPAISAC